MADPDHDQVAAPDAGIPALPPQVEASYRNVTPLTTLEAEFACPMLRAVERSSGQSVVLAMFDGGLAPSRRTQAYDRCTGAWPEHYGIPRVHDAASPDTDTPYVAWAVETGDNLRAALVRGEALPQHRVLEIGRAIAETLAELHRFGARPDHLTPAAIWLGPAGICQILGLGLDAPDRDVIGEGQRYRAPELLRREPSSMAERVLEGDLAERADVWSLGVILLELLEGRPRLASRTVDDLEREQAEVAWRPPGHVGHALASLLGAMLVLDPVHRTISAEEVAARLDDLLLDDQLTTPRGQARSTSTAVRQAPIDPASTDPPLPIPSPSQPRTDWRQAVRSVQERRHAFEAGDTTPTWKVWLFPGLGLALVFLLLWLLYSLRSSP